MFTIFVTFRSFEHPHFGLIQRNAIKSWLILNPQPEILVMGNDPGVSRACQEFGLKHIPYVKVSKQNTPMVDDMFKLAEQVASNNLLLLISGDIILFQETYEIAHILTANFRAFVATLRKRDKHIDYLIDFNNPNWQQGVRQGTTLGHPGAADFFLFTKGYFKNGILPFAVGRSSCDNWLIHEAMELGTCINLTDALEIVHQTHDHSHIEGGLVKSKEFRTNRDLGRGKMREIIDINLIMKPNRSVMRRAGWFVKTGMSAVRLPEVQDYGE